MIANKWKSTFCSFLNFTKNKILVQFSFQSLRKSILNCFANSKMLKKNAMVPFLSLIWNQRKMLLVPFRTGIKILFDGVDQLELVKKNSQIVDQLLWSIPVCKLLFTEWLQIFIWGTWQISVGSAVFRLASHRRSFQIQMAPRAARVGPPIEWWCEYSGQQ